MTEEETHDPWEAAYLRFESPAEEIRKFKRRLETLGAPHWKKNSAIAELFCGRGGGMYALTELGFSDIVGVDRSQHLLDQYHGTARTVCGDCRELPFEEQSKDILIVQGGLHHLEKLPDDLRAAFLEMRRVLRPEGSVVIVEPWLTPFLKFVHLVCDKKVFQIFYPRLEPLATMIKYEKVTYDNWLGRADEILALYREFFEPQVLKIAWGKLMTVGAPRSG